MLKDLYNLATYKVQFEANKFMAAVHEQKRHFEAAGYGRRTESWYRKTGGPTSDTQKGLRLLRGMSRDLVRNNPYAQRAITVIATNTVGSGIRPSFKGTRAKAIKKKWGEWAGSSSCDFYGNLNLYGLQEQVMRAVAESGDALIVRRWNQNSAVGFDLQILEADFLDETKTMRLDGPDPGFILQGVQFDSRGRKTGYWLYEEHPTEVAKTNSHPSRFVPASEVIHVFEALRPGQVRGIPMGVSAFIRIKDYDKFQDAQLHQQMVAACFVAMVTNTNPIPAGMQGGYSGLNQPELELTERLEPGVIQELPYGRDVKFSQPPSVSGSDVFSLTVLRAIAGGYNITYEALANDYSNVNFSSGRMGWLEFARVVTSWQDRLMVTQFCQKVYTWFEEGLQIMEGFRPSTKTDVTWTVPRREMIDPLKEGAAIIADIKAGLQSRQEALRQKGYDPDDVNAEIAEDMLAAEILNALFSTDVKYRPEDKAKPAGATVKPQATKVQKK